MTTNLRAKTVIITGASLGVGAAAARAFAREGANLVNSYTVTPVCSPSRASLMTSRYGSELGITDWLHPRNEPKKGLDPKTLTFPKVLAGAGYHVGLVGKWHLGLTDEFHPTKFGLHYFMGHRHGGFKTVDPDSNSTSRRRKFAMRKGKFRVD